MGTFERIRKISPYLIGGFAFVLILFFVVTSAGVDSVLELIPGFGKSKYMYSPKTVIGKVNGEEIRRGYYDDKVNEVVEQQQKQNQDNPDYQVNYQQIRQEVWNQIVDEMLLKQTAKKAGLEVTKEEVYDEMMENPPDYFYLKKQLTDSTGNFNKALYLELLTNPNRLGDLVGGGKLPAGEKAKVINDFKRDIISIEKYVLFTKLQNQVMSIVNSSSAIISDNFAKERYKYSYSTINYNFIFLDAKKINDANIKVSDKEISDYYDKYKSFYKVKSLRKLKYVNFVLRPSAEDTNKSNMRIIDINKDLADAKTFDDRANAFNYKLSEADDGKNHPFTLIKDIEPNKIGYLDTLKENQVSGPFQLSDGIYFFKLDKKRSGENVQVKASHILISFGSNKDSAKAEANSIIARAKKGEDFADLAKKYSQDKGSATNGGDLGYFGKGKMVKPFEEAALAAEKGQIVGPVETQFGFHIIKVTDKSSTELQFSEIRITPKISQETISNLYANARSFNQQVENGVPFETVASKMGLQLQETQYFTKEQPVLGTQYLSGLAFDDKDVKCFEPQEIKDYGIVVAQVGDFRESGIASLSDSKEKIKAKLMQTKRLDELKVKAEDLYKRTTGNPNLESLSKLDSNLKYNTAVGVKIDSPVPDAGADPELSAKLLSLPIGKISEPVRGTLGYYLVEVKSRTIADDNSINQNLNRFKQSILKGLITPTQYQGVSNVFESWYSKLKEDAQIKDFRVKYYQKEY